MVTTARDRRPGRRRRARWIGWSVLLVGVLVLAAGVVLVRDALTARDALTDAMVEVPVAEEALRAGDVAAADAALERVRPLTGTARASTDGPLWWLAGHVPVVGADVRAFAVAATVVDELATEVLPGLTAAAGVVDGDALVPRDGRVDLAPLEEAAPDVAAAAAAFDRIDERLASVDDGALHAPVADPFRDLAAKAAELRPTVRTADRLTALVPSMLGAEGPRHYLVVAMNSAELRATGGIAGAFALLSVDAGTVTLERQAATQDVGPFAAPVLPLDPGDTELYSDRLGRFVQDTTLTPDFPTAAALTAAMWEQAQGERLDGVVATDPVALAYLLEATGPVEAGGRTVDAESAVRLLLSDVYAELEAGPQTDAFFADVASAVLAATLSGHADPALARDALDRAATEHRLLVWSAHAPEQSRLADTVLSGALDDAPRAAGSLGVFLNDATGGKMGYYLASDVQLTASRCTPEGRVDTLEVTLASTAPADAAHALPWYVTGGGIAGVDPGVTRTLVVLYAARDGRIADLRADGASVPAQSTAIDGRGTLSLRQDLAPGESVTLSFDAVTPGPGAGAPADAAHPSRTGSLDVWSTPTAAAPGLRTVDVATCA